MHSNGWCIPTTAAVSNARFVINIINWKQFLLFAFFNCRHSSIHKYDNTCHLEGLKGLIVFDVATVIYDMYVHIFHFRIISIFIINFWCTSKLKCSTLFRVCRLLYTLLYPFDFHCKVIFFQNFLVFICIKGLCWMKSIALNNEWIKNFILKRKLSLHELSKAVYGDICHKDIPKPENMWPEQWI